MCCHVLSFRHTQTLVLIGFGLETTFQGFFF